MEATAAAAVAGTDRPVFAVVVAADAGWRFMI